MVRRGRGAEGASGVWEGGWPSLREQWRSTISAQGILQSLVGGEHHTFPEAWEGHHVLLGTWAEGTGWQTPLQMHLYSPPPLRTAHVLQALSTHWHPGPCQFPSCPRACTVHGPPPYLLRARLVRAGPGGLRCGAGLLDKHRALSARLGCPSGSVPPGAVSREEAL